MSQPGDDWTAALAAVDAQIAEHAAADDPFSEADAHARRAALLTAAGDLDGAIEALRRAVDLGESGWRRAKAGEPAMRQRLSLGGERETLLQLPEHRYGLGLLLARREETRDEAIAVLNFAAAGTYALNDRPRHIEMRRRMIQIFADAGDLVGASGQTQILVARLEEWGLERELFDALRMLARYQQADGMLRANRFILEKAIAAQTRAVTLALKLRDVPMLIRARLELATFHNQMGAPAKPIPFARLIEQAREARDEALVGDLQVEHAASLVRVGRWAEGEQRAEEVRQRALEKGEPVRYLLACMLIAEAREKQGDRPGVIQILLTCKATLEAEIGPAMGEPMKQVLDSLTHRWGADGVRDALVTYRQRMGAGHA